MRFIFRTKIIGTVETVYWRSTFIIHLRKYQFKKTDESSAL
jgi:hypothetical protein